ncbi:MAG: phage integrase SAM-like domain-containing protein, partial [SAR324 cluster bacterium]|nr:phage integrase SAM-like domain-containing protein [SAR324 cluster bacterium]
MSVKLRKKELASGQTSLYLDVYQEGKRQYEFLKLYLEPSNKSGNKEVLKLAESIRAKRQLEIQNSDHGFVPDFKRKSNFLDYFEIQAKARPRSLNTWNGALKHLKAFAGDRVPFNAIDDQWCEKFRTYL